MSQVKYQCLQIWPYLNFQAPLRAMLCSLAINTAIGRVNSETFQRSSFNSQTRKPVVLTSAHNYMYFKSRQTLREPHF